MLRKVNANGVESGEGFSIQIVHPEYLEYTEGKTCVPISIGYNPSSRKVYIYVSNVKDITIRERSRIANNIKDAVRLLDGNFEVV